MKFRKDTFFWLIFIILVIIFAASNISIKMNEKKKLPVEQHLPDAYITVTAPPVERNTANEIATKESLGESLKTIVFYQTNLKQVDYTIIYAEYPREVNLESGIQSVINLFKEDNFIYETKENEIQENPGAYIEGTYERNDTQFGIKEQLIKRDNRFWQILVIYPFSEKNSAAAEEFMKSVVLDNFEESK